MKAPALSRNGLRPSLDRNKPDMTWPVGWRNLDHKFTAFLELMRNLKCQSGSAAPNLLAHVPNLFASLTYLHPCPCERKPSWTTQPLWYGNRGPHVLHHMCGTTCVALIDGIRSVKCPMSHCRHALREDDVPTDQTAGTWQYHPWNIPKQLDGAKPTAQVLHFEMQLKWKEGKMIDSMVR